VKDSRTRNEAFTVSWAAFEQLTSILLLTCWPNSPLWFSAWFAGGIIYRPVCTIGLIYRLSVNILQSILRPAIRYIGNKLFLRELRRLTDRSRAYCWRVIEAYIYCACFSFKIFLFQDISLFLSFYLSSPSSISPETCSVFDGNSCRDYLKSLLFLRWNFQDYISPDFKMLHEYGRFVHTRRP